MQPKPQHRKARSRAHLVAVLHRIDRVRQGPAFGDGCFVGTEMNGRSQRQTYWAVAGQQTEIETKLDEATAAIGGVRSGDLTLVAEPGDLSTAEPNALEKMIQQDH